MGLKSLVKKAGKKAFIEYNPATNALYTTGAVINRATGGKGPLTVREALKGKKPVVYSDVTRAASGYQGKTPGSGPWRLPVANRATTTGAGKLAATVVHDVVAPTADAAAKGLFGVSLKTLAWGTAGAGAGYLVLRDRKRSPSRR